MDSAPAVIHSFPTSTLQLERNQQQAAEILTNAYKHLCDQFSAFWTRAEMQANVDARILLIYARDAVYSQSELFRGDTFAALDEVVDRLQNCPNNPEGTGRHECGIGVPHRLCHCVNCDESWPNPAGGRHQ